MALAVSAAAASRWPIDVDANQALARRYYVQGIPAVKAFRDGKIVNEFTGALPPPRVERFFDPLTPSRADGLLGEPSRLPPNGEAPEDARDPLRRAIVGILSEAEPTDPGCPRVPP